MDPEFADLVPLFVEEARDRIERLATFLPQLDSEAQAVNVAEEVETFLAADGHGSLAALAAEELLLSLPLVPRHAQGEQCVEASAEAEETQRPFADLRALLDKGRH